jgi:hypothetical protein
VSISGINSGEKRLAASVAAHSAAGLSKFGLATKRAKFAARSQSDLFSRSDYQGRRQRIRARHAELHTLKTFIFSFANSESNQEFLSRTGVNYCALLIVLF